MQHMQENRTDLNRPAIRTDGYSDGTLLRLFDSILRDESQRSSSTNRYCCEDEVMKYINNEISCQEVYEAWTSSCGGVFQTRIGSAWIWWWAIFARRASWDPNLSDSEIQENVYTLFSAQHAVEVNYYGEELNLYSTLPTIVRPPPTERNNATLAIPTVRNHSCGQDPICNRHGISDIVHYGDYVMPKHIEKELQMISLGGCLNAKSLQSRLRQLNTLWMCGSALTTRSTSSKCKKRELGDLCFHVGSGGGVQQEGEFLFWAAVVRILLLYLFVLLVYIGSVYYSMLVY